MKSCIKFYTDQELDGENGLYNYNARLYDPFIGRFISADTIVPQPFNPQSLNRYSYCLNNPLIYVDPSGHGAGVHGDGSWDPWSSWDWGIGYPGPNSDCDRGLLAWGNQERLRDQYQYQTHEATVTSGQLEGDDGTKYGGDITTRVEVYMKFDTDQYIRDMILNNNTGGNYNTGGNVVGVGGNNISNDGKKMYRATVVGVGGGFGGYLESGVMTLWDDSNQKAYEYGYFSFGGGWVLGVSAQLEVGFAIGSLDPKSFNGWSYGGNYEGILPTFVGYGGQDSYGGGNYVHTAGSHLGIPGGQAVFYASYAWYIGEKEY